MSSLPKLLTDSEIISRLSFKKDCSDSRVKIINKKEKRVKLRKIVKKDNPLNFRHNKEDFKVK